MKVLFAVSNEEVSENIVKRYQREYKEIISYKNVYYFNAILKELQKDKTYDRIVISEDLETFTHNQYDQIDKFIFEKLDSISDEASNYKGDNIPIILICADRRVKSEEMLVKLFGIGIYDALLGTDRSVEELCKLIHKPRLKKDAKVYYKIDTEDVAYKPESENDVSEVEIQNILAHYKRLGKNEQKYVESFDNIAAQYNDTQLKIICKFLPLNVRAVLEEQSPKYQKVMAFNAKVGDGLRKQATERKSAGTSEKLLKTSAMREQVLTKPVVVPNAMNLDKGKKLSKPRTQDNRPLSTSDMEARIEQNRVKKEQNIDIQKEDALKEIEKEINTYVQREQDNNDKTQPIEETDVKRGRGRPRKTPVQDTQEPVKKKRGRPRKKIEENNIKIEDIEELQKPKAEVDAQDKIDEDILMPGFDEIDEVAGSNNVEEHQNASSMEEITMPGFDEETEEFEDVSMPTFDSIIDSSEDVAMPGISSNQNFQNNSGVLPYNEKTVQSRYDIESRIDNVARPIEQETVQTIDISSLLVPGKKVACFVGTSKNGTSFIVNHVAEILSQAGISTAILDTTRNRNAYYIYTKNEEDLRNVATNCMQNLIDGLARGIQVTKNLTVYTSLPNENDEMQRSGEILQTLIKNYAVVLIDCDFQTPLSYFAYAQEIYLIQSLDVLTIQPLTAFLRELKARNILDENKLRVVLNKVERLKGISDKIILGGMSSYNDPSMSYMVDLFDKNLIKYISIPFDEQVYVKYLEGLINCELTLKGYPKNFVQILNELGNMVYPIMNGKTSGKTSYRPPSVKNGGGFTPSINSTLEQMRKY